MLLNLYKSNSYSLWEKEKTIEENKNEKYESPLILPIRDKYDQQVNVPISFLPWPTYMMMFAILCKDHVCHLAISSSHPAPLWEAGTRPSQRC